MNTGNSLITLVANEQNVIKEVNSALPEKLKIVSCTGTLSDTDYLVCLTVNHDLILDCVTFLLTGVVVVLFFLGVRFLAP